MYKLRVDGSIAEDLIWFVDNGRGAGSNDIICWEVLQCAGKTLSTMGVNVASRKRRNVGQDDKTA